jgi:DNA-binding MurR/RpiR family transcriptional regulator
MSDGLAERLRAGFPRYTRAERAVASWMLANLARLPFETAATIAEAVGVSQMTVGRFLRGLGYDNLTELKRDLQSSLGSRSLLISDRLERLGEGMPAGERLRRNFDQEVEALLTVYEQVGSPAWTRTVRRAARADAVFAAGFQTLEGVASSFVQRLAYLRPGAHLLDGRDGTFADLLEGEAREPALILLEMRRYTRASRRLAEAAAERGIPVAVICDAHCAWPRELGHDVMAIGTDSQLFWDGQAPFLSLLNLLLDAVARELGDRVVARVGRLHALQDRFREFED